MISNSKKRMNRILTLLTVLVFCFPRCVLSADFFNLAVMVCVWQRPLLTRLVLRHLSSLEIVGMNITTVVVGSEGEASRALADSFGMVYLETPNTPLGKKHNAGLQKVRELNPDAMTLIGSDDLLNAQYFYKLRDAFVKERKHVFGLRDLFFLDLASQTLVYTRGYNTAYLETAASVGLGRAYSRELLDVLDWHLWEDELMRGLDQSAVRRLLNNAPLIDTISWSVLGKEEGIMAVDVKTKGLEGGTNIWSFEDIKKGSGKGKSLTELELIDSNLEYLSKHFHDDVIRDLVELRRQLTAEQCVDGVCAAS